MGPRSYGKILIPVALHWCRRASVRVSRALAPLVTGNCWGYHASPFDAASPIRLFSPESDLVFYICSFSF
jgi:hypothetical protein